MLHHFVSEYPDVEQSIIQITSENNINFQISSQTSSRRTTPMSQRSLETFDSRPLSTDSAHSDASRTPSVVNLELPQ